MKNKVFNNNGKYIEKNKQERQLKTQKRKKQQQNKKLVCLFLSLPFSEKLLNLLVAYSPTAETNTHTHFPVLNQLDLGRLSNASLLRGSLLSFASANGRRPAKAKAAASLRLCLATGYA